MKDPRELYELSGAPVHGAPALIALTGFMDAGQAAMGAVQHLIDSHSSRIIARFDVDQLVDHRSRRPLITYDRDHYTDYQPMELVVRVVTDDAGKDFLVVTGPEPDYQWERFCAAFAILLGELGCTLAVGLHGIPWGAPHTRPVGLTAHSIDPTLIADYPTMHDKMQLPSSVEALLEVRLPAAHIRTVGFSVHVPHYLAGGEFPAGSVRLVDAAADVAELSLAVPDLRSAADEYLRELDALVAQNPENAEAIGQMEAAYDQAVAGRELPSEPAPKPVDESQIPSGDQLAAEFEQFLKDSDKGEGKGFDENNDFGGFGR
ncbi:PAC2 family protein [Luteococcus peritonei]|uniref:PAC2 family protein n=1 Tax=Luteococcus peritonei TaxID=88874 RepID=A0ABW4RTD5_9ACTN